MKPQALVCAIALTLTSCSTAVSRDEAFSGGPGEAYVLIATDSDLPKDGTETFSFQRVDLATSTFVKRDYVWVSFSANGMFGMGNQFETPDGMKTAIRFGGAKAVPGDYLLLSHSIKLHGAHIENFHCYSKGAGIYRFREGAINVVRLGKSTGFTGLFSRPASAVPVLDKPALEAQVTEIMRGYPWMTAPVAVAELMGFAGFEAKDNWLGQDACFTPEGFAFTAMPK